MLPQPNRAQLVWQGTLQGTHDLLIRKSTVVIQDVSGPSATNVAYRFTVPLPKEDLVVSLDPRMTRGYVHVVQEPKMENDYTLRIRIEDRQDGAAPYLLAVTWKTEGPEVSLASLQTPRKPVRPHDEAWDVEGKRLKITCQATWTGVVEGSARLSMKDGEAHVVQGRASGHLDLIEGTAWPKSAYHPAVVATSTDTQAKVLEQPTSKNGYTLSIELRANSSPVTIEIAW